MKQYTIHGTEYLLLDGKLYAEVQEAIPGVITDKETFKQKLAAKARAKSEGGGGDVPASASSAARKATTVESAPSSSKEVSKKKARR